MGTTGKFLTGLGMGAGAFYFLDPAYGKRRRAQIGDKASRLTDAIGDATGKTRTDAGNRMRGLAAAARRSFATDEADDRVIEERVRARMGRVVSHPGSIEVTVDHGRVTLSGPILADEVDDLLAVAASTPGITDVASRLDVHETAGNIPGLQGGTARRGIRPDLMQEYWSPTTRVLVGAAGGGLALAGFGRGGILGGVLGVAGAGLMARAVTNQPFQRLIGIGAGRRAVDFHKEITVNAPVDEVFRFWANFENFPRFMEHVREVKDSGNGRSRWIVGGPAGAPVSFEAELTRLVHNQVIAWKTVPGAIIRHAGIVKFEPCDGGTRLDIRMSYNPVAGALGHVVASLFRADPKHALDEDMVRFKSLLEHGKTTAHGKEVTRGEVAATRT